MAMRRGFHSLLGKPVDLYASNMLVYSAVEGVSFLALDLHLPWSCSFFLSAAVLRLCLEPLGALTRRIKWHLPKALCAPLTTLHRNCLLNDLKADVMRLRLSESVHSAMISQVSPSTLASQAVQSYLCVSFFRGVHHLCDSPVYYPGLSTSSFLWMPEIASFDPLFLAPAAIGVLHYAVLRRSSHPLLVPYSDSQRALAAFGSALGCVLLPGGYLLSWTGFLATHVLVHKAKSRLFRLPPS